MSEDDEMDDPVHPKDDPRSIDELFLAALSETDKDRVLDAVCALHWRGSREVLDRAISLCGSDRASERRVGAEVLGQLGVPDRGFPEECLRTLLRALETEQDLDVLWELLIALSHHHEIKVIDAALRFRNHADAILRQGAAIALMGYNEPRAIEGLIQLARDPDSGVRDWATFALGLQTDADAPELRAALLDRLADEDGTTRGAALVGLAKRKDRRVLPALREELAGECVGSLAVEAAGLIRDPSLLPLLLALRDWWDVEPETLEDAIRACSQDPDAPAN